MSASAWGFWERGQRGGGQLGPEGTVRGGLWSTPSVCLCCVILNKILVEPALRAETDRDTLRVLTSAGSVSSCDAH